MAQEGNSLSVELTVIETGGENRIDSRLVAKSLGIKHPNLMATMHKYSTRLELLGKVLFETGPSGKTNQLVKYALLNENQAIFVSNLSRNTDKVVEFKFALTIAFDKARKNENQQVYVNSDFVRRLRLNKGRVPYDHWTVLEQLDKESHHNGLGLVRLIDKARPDISVGLRWANHLRKIGHDASAYIMVPNVVHPGTMLEQDIKAYPLDLLPMFLRWFHEEYKEHFKKHYLPSRELRKQLA